MKNRYKILSLRTKNVLKKGTVETLCMLLIGLAYGCDKLPVSDGGDNGIDTIENTGTGSLIGTWRDIYPDSCLGNSLFTFLNNDTLYIDSPFDNPITRVKWTYHFMCEDTIQIVRLEEINPDKRMTNSRIVFYNSDSILIEKFSVSDAAVYPPQFSEIKLLKMR